MFAFNAVSGAPVWAKAIGYRSSCFNVGIGSTPAISGTQVVVGEDNAASNPAYHGIDTVSGTMVWTNTMSVGASGFPWASAFLYNNKAYVGISSRCDNPSVRGELRAVDMSTGNTVGSTFFVNAGERGGGIWNSAALSPDGSKIAVGTGEDYSCSACTYTRAMVSVDTSSMSILGFHQEPSPNQDLDFGTTPVIFHDNQGRTLVGAGHKNGTFYVYDLNNVSAGAIWTRGGGTSVGLMPAYDPDFGSGGTLFIVNSSITAVDPANGGVRWGPVSIGGSHGNIAIANGLIFVNRGSSGLDIRSETDGSLIRNLPPQNPGAANSGVAVSNGFVYWLSGSYVNAWSLPDCNCTPSPTSTQAPPTNTPTPIPTHTATVPPVAPTATNSPTTAPSNTPGGPTATNTPPPTATSTAQAATHTSTPTQEATVTPGAPTSTPGGPTSTETPIVTPEATQTQVPTQTPTACAISFTDVPVGSTFYEWIRCLACMGIINGYPDGTFKPNNTVTRGQLSKIVSNAAGYNEPAAAQIFEDVPPGSTFYDYIYRLGSREYMEGYPCGGAGEPCVPPGNLPYFRPNNNATRGQISKIVNNAAGYSEPAGAQIFEDVAPGSTFYDFIWRLADRGIMQGYPCGSVPTEPCVPPGNRPYFRPNNNATRGQTSKIVANTFFPGCNPPRR
jgi:hypothetical protein